MSFIIINTNTYDVILKILYILATRINIYIKEKFQKISLIYLFIGRNIIFN